MLGQSCPLSWAVHFTAAAASGQKAPCHSELPSTRAQTLQGEERTAKGERDSLVTAMQTHATTVTPQPVPPDLRAEQKDLGSVNSGLALPVLLLWSPLQS